MSTEKQTLLQQRDNTAFLLTDVIPWMLANPDRVDLDEIHSDCGAFGCVLGWYSMRKYNRKYRQIAIIRNDRYWEELEFGMAGNGQWFEFFGMEDSGTLEQRIPRIQKHLDELDAQIAAL